MYEIIRRRMGVREVVDTADNLEDAKFLVGEYQATYGPDWEVTYRKV